MREECYEGIWEDFEGVIWERSQGEEDGRGILERSVQELERGIWETKLGDEKREDSPEKTPRGQQGGTHWVASSSSKPQRRKSCSGLQSTSVSNHVCFRSRPVATRHSA